MTRTTRASLEWFLQALSAQALCDYIASRGWRIELVGMDDLPVLRASAEPLKGKEEEIIQGIIRSESKRCLIVAAAAKKWSLRRRRQWRWSGGMVFTETVYYPDQHHPSTAAEWRYVGEEGWHPL